MAVVSPEGTATAAFNFGSHPGLFQPWVANSLFHPLEGPASRLTVSLPAPQFTAGRLSTWGGQLPSLAHSCIDPYVREAAVFRS